MKYLLTLLTLLFLLPGLSLAQGKPITYTARAIPLRVVLEDISKQSGMKLKAMNEMEAEPLILRLDNVPMSDVMAKMADVFQADWVDHKDYWRLERSEEKVAALRESAFQRKLRAVKKGIDSLLDMDAKNGPLDARAADNLMAQAIRFDQQHKNDTSMRYTPEDVARDRQMPNSRLGIKLLSLMDPLELAKIKEGDRVVYSTTPTSTQRQFPKIDPAIIDQWTADVKTLHDAYERAKPKFESMWSGDYQTQAQIPTSKPTRLVVTIESYAETATLITFALLGEKDEYLVDESEGIGIQFNEAFDHRLAMQKVAEEARKTGFEVGMIQREIWSHGNRVGSQIRPLSPEAVDVVLHPTTIDPLALGTGDTVLIGSKLENLNAIALVPDADAFYAGIVSSDGKTSLKEYVGSLWRSRSDAQVADGWLVIKPKDAQLAQDQRMPRSVMQEFLQKSLSDHGVSIEAAADLRASLPLDADLSLASDGVSVLLGSLAADAINAYDPTLSRFYGFLDAKDRNTAAQDTLRTTVSALSDDQKNLIQKWVFGNTSYLHDLVPVKSSTTWQRDATDLLPNGIAADSPISITDRVIDMAFVTQQSPSGSSYAMPAEGNYLASLIVRYQHPELFEHSDFTKPSGFRTGKQRVVTIKIDLDGKYQDVGMLTENHPSSDIDLTIEAFLKQLPPDRREALMQEVNEQIERMKTYQQKNPSTATGGQKPPAREAA